MKIRFWAAIAVVLSPLVAQADAVTSLKTRLDRLHSLSGQFHQTLSDRTGAKVQESSGEFHLLRPDYFLWKSAAPYEQTVLGTPDKVWVYDPDLEQVTIQARTPEQKNNPASLLVGDVEEIRGAFEVSESAAKGTTSYRLTPLTPHSSYKVVEFVFADDALKRLAFMDKLEQKTDIEFTHLELNPKLSREFFIFTPPEGTDIIVDE